jgi:hypothetical protein
VGPSSSSNQRSSSPAWFLPSSLSGTNQQVLLGLAAAAGLGVFGSGFELNGPWSVLEALAVLASIIAVHEWGHFTAARLQGIHVTQFAIGFGPPLISFKVGMVWAVKTTSVATNSTACGMTGKPDLQARSRIGQLCQQAVGWTACPSSDRHMLAVVDPLTL